MTRRTDWLLVAVLGLVVAGCGTSSVLLGEADRHAELSEKSVIDVDMALDPDLPPEGRIEADPKYDCDFCELSCARADRIPRAREICDHCQEHGCVNVIRP